MDKKFCILLLVSLCSAIDPLCLLQSNDTYGAVLTDGYTNNTNNIDQLKNIIAGYLVSRIRVCQSFGQD